MSDRAQHTIDNAKNWLVKIREMVEAFTASADDDHDDMAVAEETEQAIQESPLSVQVRSGWYDPASATSAYESGPPADYEILLTTGGPALRIIGELADYAEPVSAKLQWQDWGTPWTDFHMSDLPEGMTPSGTDELLLSYAGHFYFGS